MTEITDAGGRYELSVDGVPVAVSTYRDTGLRRVFLHTEVEPGHEHHGLATQLIEWALNDVRAKGKQIVPLCSMVAGYLEKNHDFDDIVDSPAGIEG